ncbi:MAG: hypothetical protein ACLQU1_24325 [Bryobacteraceae bacterium]
MRGFFKQRGYEDSTELAQHRIARLPAGPPLADYGFEDAKIFDKADSAKLRSGKALEMAGAFLESQPFALAVVADPGCLTVLGESGSWHRAVGSTAVMVSKLVLDFSAKNI